ncbi:hypothetical protein K474DRAFT_1323572 [Panus rudis PR-1116 ss-1]|nr:hypothetical protein K474DRAFT_1323572 [Panus rudis PR-1116 ss-1]
MPSQIRQLLSEVTFRLGHGHSQPPREASAALLTSRRPFWTVANASQKHRSAESHPPWSRVSPTSARQPFVKTELSNSRAPALADIGLRWNVSRSFAGRWHRRMSGLMQPDASQTYMLIVLSLLAFCQRIAALSREADAVQGEAAIANPHSSDHVFYLGARTWTASIRSRRERDRHDDEPSWPCKSI